MFCETHSQPVCPASGDCFTLRLGIPVLQELVLLLEIDSIWDHDRPPRRLIAEDLSLTFGTAPRSNLSVLALSLPRQQRNKTFQPNGNKDIAPVEHLAFPFLRICHSIR